MDDIWIISWFNHTAFDANPIWKSPILALARPPRCAVLLLGPRRFLAASASAPNLPSIGGSTRNEPQEKMMEAQTAAVRNRTAQPSKTVCLIRKIVSIGKLCLL